MNEPTQTKPIILRVPVEIAILIHADGKCAVMTPTNDKPRFSQEELQAMVGGCIKRTCTRDGAPMWVNEDGIRLDLPLNMVATALVEPVFMDFTLAPGGVRGNVVVKLTELFDQDLVHLAESGGDE